MNIFLDDERCPKDVKWIELPLVKGTIVRSYDEFIKKIKEYGSPKRISFDHDLSDDAYAEVLRGKMLEFNYDNVKSFQVFNNQLDENKKATVVGVYFINQKV